MANFGGSSQKQILKRLEHVESLLKELSKQGKMVYVHIEHLNARDTKLEHLDFNLDHLDIDEVSGALNLGNNFGVKVEEKKNIPNVPKKKPSVKTASHLSNLAQSHPTKTVRHNNSKIKTFDKKNTQGQSASEQNQPGLHPTQTGYTYKFGK